MRKYFESRYSADNVFVAAAGKVDFDALVEQVAKRCGDWKAQGRTAGCAAGRSETRFEVVHRPTATQQYVLQLADAPASEDADRYAAKLLATIVGDDSGSRMYWELTDPGLAETASLGTTNIWAWDVLHVAGLRAGDGRRESQAASGQSIGRSSRRHHAKTNCGRRRTK